MNPDIPPLNQPKAYDEASVFLVDGLQREARRQRGLADSAVPAVCLLDPDGDVVRHLSRTGDATRLDSWACYHSEMWITKVDDLELGIVPCAVGGPYAVMVAEELQASGCELIISVTSAGRILPVADPPFFVLISRAWRDEGTSLHYLPPSEWVEMRAPLAAMFPDGITTLDEPVTVGSSWTTDAPFRETPSAIAAAEHAGIHAVEMEAAGLYAYAQAMERDVICVAHVTNNMAVDGDDFEKGVDAGTHRILALVEAIADRWEASRTI